MIYASFDVGTVNLAFCIIDENEIIKYWDVINIKSSDPIKTCRLMVEQLDGVELLKQVDQVIVEKQPSCNPKMRVIEGFIVSYFCIRSKTCGVTSYSPKYKLNCYDGFTPNFNVKSEYTERKKTGIYHTKHLIVDQDPKFIELFDKSKKKDDLADCYLQALSYIRYKNRNISKSVVARKPTKKQLKYKKFNICNIKYLINEYLKKQDKSTSIEDHIINFIIDYNIEEEYNLEKLITKNTKILYSNDEVTLE